LEWQASLTGTGIIQQSGPKQCPSEQTQAGWPCHFTALAAP